MPEIQSTNDHPSRLPAFLSWTTKSLLAAILFLSAAVTVGCGKPEDPKPTMPKTPLDIVVEEN